MGGAFLAPALTTADAAEPAGAEQLRALDEVVAGVQERLLAPLPPADRTQLVGLLTRLLKDDSQPA